MFNVTRILCDLEQPMDGHRYGRGHDAEKSARGRRPVVVWNVTRTCNLRCVHCYSDSEAKHYDGELNHEEALKLVDDLAEYGVPALLLSGGEPLARPDLFEIARYARKKGIKLTLSTNGTLIDRKRAEAIKETGFTYVGISFDGIGATNDLFRGRPGAFERAHQAIRELKSVGQKVGLRLTLTPQTIADLDEIFDFIEREGIERACFYHLVPAGRGRAATTLDLDAARGAVSRIFERTLDLAQRGDPREILTVDNHADAPFAYLTLAAASPQRAAKAREMLLWNGGASHSTGRGIGNIDFYGNVHPDQFMQQITLGNVRERKFSEIWEDESIATLAELRDRSTQIRGRCASCNFFDLCGGGFRARSLGMTGDMWGSDPGCYLTDEEIARSA